MTKEPTCTQEGEKTVTCTRCKETTTETVDKLLHTPGEAIRENEKDATCTEAASYDEVVYCTVCGAEVSRETVTTAPATGHSFSSQWSSDENAHWHASTCGHNVTADYAVHPFEGGACPVCGYEQSGSEEDKETLEYVLSNDGAYYIVKGIGSVTSSSVIIPETYNGLPVTQIAEGAFKNCTFVSISISVNIVYIGADAFAGCTNLVAVYYGGTVTEWVNIVFENIYSNPLYIGHYFYIDGDLVVNLIIPEGVTEIKDYAFAGGIFVTIHINVTVVLIGDGVFSGTVSDTVIFVGTEDWWLKIEIGEGNDLLADIIFHIHHYAVVETKPVTCTEDGLRTYTCSCGIGYTEVIPASGHTPGPEATCISDQVCIKCGMVLDEKLGHDTVEHAGKAPTCTEEGWNDYVTCTRCGYTTYRLLPALGHDWTIEVEKEPTCTEAGSILYACTRCEESYRITTHAAHNYELIETVAATCTKDGYQLFRCTVCGEEYRIVIPAEAGHNYVGEVTLAPTTEREGEMTYTCTRCGDSYTVPLAKLNSGSGYVLLIQDRLPWTTDNNAVILNYLTDS